jgi:hypothetical protein
MIGVTNWHVAVRDGYSVIRANTPDGNTEILEYDPADWLCKPKGHDVAVTYIDAEGSRLETFLIDKSMILPPSNPLQMHSGPQSLLG